MNSNNEELVTLVDGFLADLNSVHEQAVGSWRSLLGALIPVWHSLETTPAAMVAEDLSAAAMWEDAIQNMSTPVATTVSQALARFSEALTQHYRAVTPRDHRISQALSLIYLDVQRPLWAAHPGLRPFDLPE